MKPSDYDDTVMSLYSCMMIPILCVTTRSEHGFTCKTSIRTHPNVTYEYLYHTLHDYSRHCSSPFPSSNLPSSAFSFPSPPLLSLWVYGGN